MEKVGKVRSEILWLARFFQTISPEWAADSAPTWIIGIFYILSVAHLSPHLTPPPPVPSPHGSSNGSESVGKYLAGDGGFRW